MFVALAKWLFYDLRVFRDSKSPPLSQKSQKLFKYLMEIDLSHEWQTVTSTIFHFKTFSMFVALAKWLFYDKESSEILKSTLSQKS
jgi:glucose uptake protein GlcU